MPVSITPLSGLYSAVSDMNANYNIINIWQFLVDYLRHFKWSNTAHSETTDWQNFNLLRNPRFHFSCIPTGRNVNRVRDTVKVYLWQIRNTGTCHQFDSCGFLSLKPEGKCFIHGDESQFQRWRFDTGLYRPTRVLTNCRLNEAFIGLLPLFNNRTIERGQEIIPAN